jgi:hypothetical protein
LTQKISCALLSRFEIPVAKSLVCCGPKFKQAYTDKEFLK